MIPSTIPGLIVLVGALTPGYTWTWYAERRAVRPSRSGLLEAAEMLFVGVLFTGIATVILLALGEGIAWLPSITEVVSDARSFMVDNPWATVVSAASVIGVANGAALAVSYLVHRGRDSISHESAFHRTLKRHSSEMVGVALELDDGRFLQGYLKAYDVTPGEERDIVLQPPIELWREQDGTLVPIPQPHDCAIVRSDSVRTTWVMYLGRSGQPTDSS